MNREVHIYIEGLPNSNDYDKIDLFGDEKINVSSSIQNIQDLSKVYTDFSQSFTIPASPNNNRIFEYFHESDVNGAIDHNLRRYAYIEIGHVPFRTGKIQLEGSVRKNNKVEFYTITFYGDLISLKDTFGSKKLSQLNYTFISNPYTGAAVKSRVTDTTTDYDVRYPLIASEKLWSYADATSTDLSTTEGRIDWRELFPAIKVSKIFQAIQTDFGLTFQSTFLLTDRFKKLFLWCKNTDNLEKKINGSDLPITTFTQYPDYLGNDVTKIYYEVDNAEGLDDNIFLLETQSLTITDINVNFLIDNPPISTDPQWVIYLDVFVNGTLYSTVKIDTTTSNNALLYSLSNYNTSKFLYFKIRSESAINIKYTITVDRKYMAIVGGVNTIVNGGYVTCRNTTGLALSTGTNSIFANMPDITVADFFSGILKMFNLTCYATGFKTFQIEPLDNWYSKGRIIPITKYVDIDNISIDRLPLYKNISLNYQKSESVINKAFSEGNGREYGDVTNSYPYDGGDYNITVPFENLEFNQFLNTPLQVAYALTGAPDFKPYVPKPVLMYFNGATTTSIQFYDGTTETNETNIALFGQDLSTNNDIYSLNFSTDNSTWYNKLIDNSLFACYYFGYLSNLFNLKNRLVKVKAYFPIDLLTTLKLNDRLVIEDKRYLINTMNTDITTGEVNLELIHDFRPILNTSVNPIKDPEGGTIKVELWLGNEQLKGTISTDTAGVTFSETVFYEDILLEITTSAETNPIYEITTEQSNQRITEDGYTRISEQGVLSPLDVKIEYEAKNGTITNETIFIL